MTTRREFFSKVVGISFMPSFGANASKHLRGSEHVSVKAYGAVGDGVADDTRAFAQCLSSNKKVWIPQGRYKIGKVECKEGFEIINDGEVIGSLIVRGVRKSIFEGDGSIPKGGVRLPLKNHSFKKGDRVKISIDGLGRASVNQSGIDLVEVAEAWSNGIVVSGETRFAYEKFTVESAEFTASEAEARRGGDRIKVKNPASFLAGDLVRIECIAGDDGVFSQIDNAPAGLKDCYFEINRIRAVVGRDLILEFPLAYGYQRFLVLKMPRVAGVGVFGGKFGDILLDGVCDINIEDVAATRISIVRSLNFQLKNIKISADGPIGFGITSSRVGRVSTVIACCSRGASDNGNLKVMSGIDISFEDIKSNGTKASNQGVYPIFVDFYYTPYNGWSQGLHFKNCVLGRPEGGAQRSFWMVGARDCTISDVKAESTILIEKSRDIKINNVDSENFLVVREAKELTIGGFSVRGIRIEGGVNLIFREGNINWIRGQPAIWVGSSKNKRVSGGVRMQNIAVKGVGETEGRPEILVQDSKSLFVEDLKYKDGRGLNIKEVEGSAR